jgi:hypothetical protein
MAPLAAHGSKDGHRQQQQQQAHHRMEHAPGSDVNQIQAALQEFQAAVRQQLSPYAAAGLPAPSSTLTLASYYTQHLPHDRLIHLIQRMAVILQSNSRGHADQQLAQLVGATFLAGVEAADLQEAREVMLMVVRPISGLLWLAQEEPTILVKAVTDAARYQRRRLQQQPRQEGAAADTGVRMPEVIATPGMTLEQLVQIIQQHAAAASKANLAYPGGAGTAAAAAGGVGSRQASKGTKRKREEAAGCPDGTNGSSVAGLGGSSSSSACAGDTDVAGAMDEELLRTPMALIVRGMGCTQAAQCDVPPANAAHAQQRPQQQQSQKQQQRQPPAGNTTAFLNTLLQQTLPFHLTPFHFNNGKAGQAACFLDFPLPGVMAWEVSLLCELAAWSALTQWAAQTPAQAADAASAAEAAGGGAAAAAAAAGGGAQQGAGVSSGTGWAGSPAAAEIDTQATGPLSWQQAQASVLHAWQLLEQGVLEGPGWRMFGVALRAWYPGQLDQRLQQLQQQQQQLQAPGARGSATAAAGHGRSRGASSSHQQQQGIQGDAGDPIQKVVDHFGCVLYAAEMVVGDIGGLGTAAAAAGLYDSSARQQVRMRQQSTAQVEVQQLFSYMNAGSGPAAAVRQVQQSDRRPPNDQLQQRQRHKQQQQTQEGVSGQAAHSTVLPPVWGLVVEQPLTAAAAGAEGGAAGAPGGEEPLLWPCCLLSGAAEFVALTQAGPLDATNLLLMDDLVGTVLRWATQLDQQQQQTLLDSTGAAAAAAGGGGGGGRDGGHRRMAGQQQPMAAAGTFGGSTAAGPQPQQQQPQQQQPLVNLLHHLLSSAGQEPSAAAAGLQQLLDRLQKQRRLLSVSVGVTQPVDILSSWCTTTQLHLEQCALGSMNHMLAGAGKLWFVCVTPASSLRLEQLVVSKFGSLAPLLDKQLGLQDFTLTELLDIVGMEAIWQEPGDLVLTLPGPSYHITVSSGPSLAVSANCYFDGGACQLVPHLAHWAPKLVGQGGAMLPQHQSVLAAFGMPEEEDWDVGLIPLHLAAELSAAIEHGVQEQQQQQQQQGGSSAAAGNGSHSGGWAGMLRASAAAVLGAFTRRGAAPPPQQQQQQQQAVWGLCRQRCAQWLALGNLVKGDGC